MAKERGDMCEKRAQMAQERAGDLERTLRDSVLHVEWLESELANSRRRGGAGGAGAGGADSSAAVSELTERLRRAELNAEKRNHALEERLRLASERAAKAEARSSEVGGCTS
jgi:hypothetical protein